MKGNLVSRLVQEKIENHAVRAVHTQVAPMEAERHSELALADLIRILRRRHVIILSILAFAVILGTIYCLVTKPVYEAKADLAINPEGVNSLDMGDITASLGGGGLGF